MLVAKWQCEETWPLTPFMAQAAFNASNMNADPESELTGMMSIVRVADAQAKTGDVNWAECKDAALCGKQKWESYIDDLGLFAENFAGGEGGPALVDVATFADAFGPSKYLGGGDVEVPRQQATI